MGDAADAVGLSGLNRAAIVELGKRRRGNQVVEEEGREWSGREGKNDGDSSGA